MTDKVIQLHRNNPSGLEEMAQDYLRLLSSEGQRECEQVLEDQETYNQLSSQERRHFEETLQAGLHFQKEYEAALKDPLRKGVKRVFSDIEFHFGLNPQQLINECKAEKALKKWLPRLSTSSGEKVEKQVKKTHRMLLEGIKPEIGGEYRGLPLYIQSNERDRAVQLIMRAYQTQKESKEKMLSLFAKLFPVHTDASWPPQDMDRQQEDELLEVISARRCADPDEIAPLMLEWAEKLIEIYKQKAECPQAFNPVATAAFVHMSLIHIHPFFDWNGHTSRLFCRVILEESGYPTVVFPDLREYITAVRLDLANIRLGFPPGIIFADYLARLLEKTHGHLAQFATTSPFPFV